VIRFKGTWLATLSDAMSQASVRIPATVFALVLFCSTQEILFFPLEIQRWLRAVSSYQTMEKPALWDPLNFSRLPLESERYFESKCTDIRLGLSRTNAANALAVTNERPGTNPTLPMQFSRTLVRLGSVAPAFFGKKSAIHVVAATHR